MRARTTDLVTGVAITIHDLYAIGWGFFGSLSCRSQMFACCDVGRNDVPSGVSSRFAVFTRKWSFG
jgi:hypothetical protein